jgi:hypothetical protein
MPPAEGNFNEHLELLWGGRGVAARGPLEWDKEEASSAALHVAIMQESVAAIGRTGDDLTPVASEFLIAATVQGAGTLTPGPAFATGLALGPGRNGPEMYQWSVPVMLTETAESHPAAGLAEDLAPGKKVRTPA